MSWSMAFFIGVVHLRAVNVGCSPAYIPSYTHVFLTESLQISDSSRRHQILNMQRGLKLDMSSFEGLSLLDDWLL